MADQKTVVCVHCGRTVRPGARFCANCGTSLYRGSGAELATDGQEDDQQPPAPTSRPRTFRRSRAFMVAAALLGIALVGGVTATAILLARARDPVPSVVAGSTSPHTNGPTPSTPVSSGTDARTGGQEIPLETSAAGSSSTSATTLAEADRPVAPDVKGRSPVMRIMPSGKSMLVGETAEIEVEAMTDSSGYAPVEFQLRSDDPSIASVEGGMVTAVGPGTTSVHAVTNIGTEYVSISVYPDTEARENAGPFEAFMPEVPIYTDGRVTIGAWLPTGREAGTEVTVVGFLYNATEQDLPLSVDQFSLRWPSDRWAPAAPDSRSGFEDSMFEGEPLGDSCVSTPGDEVGLGLVFLLPDGVDWTTGWLIFDDGDSLIAVPARDISKAQ